MRGRPSAITRHDTPNGDFSRSQNQGRLFLAALAQLGSWEQSVESRATPGGASRASVELQIEELSRSFQGAASV